MLWVECFIFRTKNHATYYIDECVGKAWHLNILHITLAHKIVAGYPVLFKCHEHTHGRLEPKTALQGLRRKPIRCWSLHKVAQRSKTILSTSIFLILHSKPNIKPVL